MCCIKEYRNAQTLIKEGYMSKVEITGVNTQDLKTIPYKETQELLIQAKAGDLVAREKLIVGNLKLVLSVLKKFNNRKEHMELFLNLGYLPL